MSSKTKIQLSPFEMDLLNNADLILTKNQIIHKTKMLLEGVLQTIWDHTRKNPEFFSAEIYGHSPKISRGENYLGLPWLMLDYPRRFEKVDVFAIRTMFWWGNFFSTTLLLAGKYKQLFQNRIADMQNELADREFYFCICDDPWHHHLEKENYTPVKDFSANDFIKQLNKRSFIKLTQKTSLSRWDEAEEILSENFKWITKTLHQFPRR